MGIFSKKNGTKESSKVKSELTRASHQRDALRARLPELRAELSLATDERRGLLTAESIADANIPRDRINQARDRLEDVEYLIEQCDGKITTLENDLGIALAHEERERAVSELEPHIAQLAEQLDRLKVVGTALAAAATSVCARVPFANQNFGRQLADLVEGVNINVTGVITDANNHIAALKAGNAKAKSPEAPYVVPKPVEVQCVSVVPICDVKWREGDEIKTAPRYSIWPIPQDVVRRASAAGWVLFANSPEVAQMRAAEIYGIGQRWAKPDTSDCRDLDADPLPLAPGRQAPAMPVDTVERTAPAITGTASVSAT